MKNSRGLLESASSHCLDLENGAAGHLGAGMGAGIVKSKNTLRRERQRAKQEPAQC